MGFVPVKETVTEEGYTIPRFLIRHAAAAIDFSICFAVVALLFILIYPFGFMPTLGDAIGISETTQALNDIKLASYLYTDETGMVTYQAFDDYKGYQKVVEDYYLVYQNIDNTDNPSPKGYDAYYYNIHVLMLPESTDFINNSQYFEWAIGEDEKPDSSKQGTIKRALLDENGNVSSAVGEELKQWFQRRYSEAVNEFESEPYFVALKNKNTALTVTAEMLAILPPCLGFYVFIPLFDKLKRRTLGKRIMKLATIDVNGEPLKWYFVLLRVVVAALLLVSAFLFDDLVVTLAILITGFLVSWGFATFSERKRALHDFIAHSVVVRDNDRLFAVEEPKHGK